MLIIVTETLQNITPLHFYFPMGLHTKQHLSDNFHMPVVRLDMLQYDKINLFLSIHLHMIRPQTCAVLYLNLMGLKLF